MRSVHAEASIASDPNEIIRAFMEQPHLQGWWGVARSLVEPKAGGIYTLAWEISDTGIKYISSGTIEKIVPHECLRIHKMVYLNPGREILGPMELEVQVARTDESHTRVDVVQSGYQYGGDWDWYHDAVVQAWPFALNLLKKYLESESPEVGKTGSP